MTDKLLIERELLEQVASEFEHDNDRYMLGRELRKVLSAPRQPEGEGLEVVAWLVEQGRTFQNRAFISEAGAVRSCDERQDRAIVSDLCRLSDAQRAIAELRQECERLRAVLDGAEYPNIDRLKALSVETCREVGRTVGSMTKALQAERDTLRQQLAERDAAIEEWSGTAVQNGMECDRLAANLDKLAGLLREAYGFTTADGGLLPERIKAALPEVEKAR